MSIFNKVRLEKPPRNKFDLSHERKFSFNMADLIPILCEEVMPGDVFRNKSQVFLRLAPMIAPIMHRINVRVESFYVPYRLIWDDFPKFVTGGEDGLFTAMPPEIYCQEGSKGFFGSGTLADYLVNFPAFDATATLTAAMGVSSLPFRAYQLIYNEYYRDQNLTPAVQFSKTSGVDPSSYAQLTALRKRAWEKDYFTSALPWPQRGPAVVMPIEGEGEVEYLNNTKVFSSVTQNPLGGTPMASGAPNNLIVGGTEARVENIDSINVTNSSVTINDLRRSVRLQEWLERMAIGGARFTEQIRAMFDVKSSDARLQRPEYLGGARNPVTISEVLSTFQDEATGSVPQGNMAGHGYSAGSNFRFKRRFEEHGVVISLLSVLPRTAYQQGLSRVWTKQNKFDFPWPLLANIGEQEVKNKEVYWNGVEPTTQDNTFGYQSRYAEYKFVPSSVHGEFRGNLDMWHMGRKFATPPALNTAFVEANPTQRVFNVIDEHVHKLYCHVHNDLSAIRPLPYFGTPTL